MAMSESEVRNLGKLQLARLKRLQQSLDRPPTERELQETLGWDHDLIERVFYIADDEVDPPPIHFSVFAAAAKEQYDRDQVGDTGTYTRVWCFFARRPCKRRRKQCRLSGALTFLNLVAVSHMTFLLDKACECDGGWPWDW